jgi:DNA replication protein DnaC
MAIKVKVLFFDDIWASENVSEAQKTKLKFILDEREKKELITIFSTNLSALEIEKLYWKRIKSRVYNWKHKKWLQLITIPWEDKRKENIDQISL